MIPEKWVRVAGRAICAAWIGLTVAFFAMITSAGTESMELEIGPFLALQGGAATIFVQAMIAFGLMSLVLFILQRPSGFIMAIAWSVFWALILSTALVSAPSDQERVTILVTVVLFCWSGWYSWARCWVGRRRPRPADSTDTGIQSGG